MSSIAISFKNLAIGLAALGLTLGAAFGAGIAYGRTEDDSQTASAPSQNDFASIIATRGAGANGGATGGLGGGLANLFGGYLGTITAIDGDTITVETAQGVQQIHVAGSTGIELLQAGTAADLREGAVVLVTGEEGENNVIEAESVTEVPAELQSLPGGATPGQNGGFTPPNGAQPGQPQATPAASP